jgi:hypothetical protein
MPSREELLHFAALEWTRCVEAGCRESGLPARDGRATSSPPQLGQLPWSVPSAHVTQNVHSNEQIRASVDPGGRSRSQHSQLGLISSIADSVPVGHKILPRVLVLHPHWRDGAINLR